MKTGHSCWGGIPILFVKGRYTFPPLTTSRSWDRRLASLHLHASSSCSLCVSKMLPRLQTAFLEHALCQAHMKFTLTKALVLGLLWNIGSAMRKKTCQCILDVRRSNVRAHRRSGLPLPAVRMGKISAGGLRASCLALYWCLLSGSGPRVISE